jgi:hypothetical protein
MTSPKYNISNFRIELKSKSIYGYFDLLSTFKNQYISKDITSIKENSEELTKVLIHTVHH